MARQTAAERAEAARASAQAREAAAKADLARRKSELAGLLSEVLAEVLTGVERSNRASSRAANATNATDPLDVILQSRPWPPRYGGGGHRHGAVIPHRLSGLTFMRAVPMLYERFQIRNGAVEIPDEFWSQDELSDGRMVAAIACPCGAEPIVPLGGVGFCTGEDCPRVFFHIGRTIRVARMSEDEQKALVEPDQD